MGRGNQSGCGAPCCQVHPNDLGIGIIVELEEHEVDQYPEALAGPNEVPGRTYILNGAGFIPTQANGRCIHLTDEDLCAIYDRRPAACREFDCESSHDCVEV